MPPPAISSPPVGTCGTGAADVPPSARAAGVRGRLASRQGLSAACVVLLAVLLVSVVVAVGLGSAVITPGETARYLWAALSGGHIAADEVTTYQIIWQIRTPRVLTAALVARG